MGIFNLHADNTDDPPAVRNWRIHLMAVIVSLGAVAMGYDTSVIGGTMALDSFKRDFGLQSASQNERDVLQGNIVSTFQAGCFFGSLITFPLGEKFGRKKAIMFASLIFCIGGAMMTASNGMVAVLIAGRAVAGLGIGSVSLLVPVYIAETSPPSIRGRLVGIFEIASQGGGMLGFWINYAVNQTMSKSTKTQWIVPLALQLVPGALLFFGIFWCPESPRWYAKKDRWEEAAQTLAKIRHLDVEDAYIQKELSDVRLQIALAQPPGGGRMTKKYMFQRLLQKGTRNRIAIGLLLMAMQNCTGVNIITYYSPRIFETLGITGTDTKLFATGFYGVAKTLGMIVFSVYLVEKVGRRKGLIWGAFIGSLPMWYIGGYVIKADPAGAAARGVVTQSGAGYFAMVCVYLYGFIYCMTWQGITWVYCSEIFPYDIRLLCVAITTADQWLWSFVISRTTPFMITSLNGYCYILFGTLMVLMGFWAWWAVPETKGKSLEEMEALFGVPAAVEAAQAQEAKSSGLEMGSDEFVENVNHRQGYPAEKKGAQTVVSPV